MKLPITLLLILACLSAHAESPPGFTFKEVQACNDKLDPYTGADVIRAQRIKTAVEVTVTSSLSCGGRAVPDVHYGRGVVSIGLDVQYEKGAPVAACNCMRRFVFMLTEPVKPRTPIYLVAYGKATAHTTAP